MRQTLLIIATVLLVALAGCTGGLGGTDTVDTDQDNETTDDAQSTDEDQDEEGIEPDNATPPPDPTGELEIHHIDVGQADATLLLTPDGESILVDTGDWRQDGADVIAYLEELGVDRVDHLVATHAHADHIGGHAAVIEHFETDGEGIGAAYDSGVAHDSATYDNYLDAIEEYNVDLFEVVEGDEFPINDESLEATVLNPPEDDSGTDLHYNSITIAFQFGDTTYLTTGDAEEDAEQRLVDDHESELEADAYHAGHHGSSTSSTPVFMDAVQPEIAIISSDFDSQYGHPHDEVLEEYAERGIETYWTGVHGDIVLTTDGEEIGIETASEFSTDAADLLDEKPREEDNGESYAITPGVSQVTAPPITN